jgi:hypothetical protein
MAKGKGGKHKLCKFLEDAAAEEGDNGKLKASCDSSEEGSEEEEETLSDQEFQDDTELDGYNGPQFIMSNGDLEFERRLAALQAGQPLEPAKQPRASTKRVLENPARPARASVKGVDKVQRMDPSMREFICGKPSPVAVTEVELPPVRVAPLWKPGGNAQGNAPKPNFSGKKGLKTKKTAAPVAKPLQPGIYMRKDGTQYRIDEDLERHEGPDV